MSLALLMGSTLYSQTVTLNKNKDTTVCFTVNQSKFLLKQIYELQKCDTLNSIYESQMNYCDSIFKSFNSVKKDFSMFVENSKGETKIYEYQITSLNAEIKDEKRKTRTQKFYKVVAIGLGSLGTGFMTYLWIKK